MAEAIAGEKMPCKHGKSCFMRNNASHEKAFFHPDQFLPAMASPSVKTSLAPYVSPYKSVEKASPGDDDFSGDDDDDSDDDEEEVVRIAPHERAYQMRAAAAKEDQSKFAGSIASGKIGATGPTGLPPKPKARRRGPPKAAPGGSSGPPSIATQTSTPVSLGHAAAGSHQYEAPPSPRAVVATSSSGSGVSRTAPPSFNAAPSPPSGSSSNRTTPPPFANGGSASYPAAAAVDTTPHAPVEGGAGPAKFCRECGFKFGAVNEMFCGDCGARRK